MYPPATRVSSNMACWEMLHFWRFRSLAKSSITKWVIFRQATDLTTGGYKIRNTNRLGTVINPVHCYSYSQHPRYVWGVKWVDAEVKNPVSSMWLYPPTPADGKGERVRAERFFEASSSSSCRPLGPCCFAAGRCFAGVRQSKFSRSSSSKSSGSGSSSGSNKSSSSRSIKRSGSS